MIDAPMLAWFAGAATAVIVVPGPTTLLALSHGNTGGLRLAGFGIAGAALSDLILIGAVAVGLGSAAMASTAVFLAIKSFGIAYLAWLALQLWRTADTAIAEDPPQDLPRTPTPAPTPAGACAFVRCLAVALGNPKGWLFFCALLPQFVRDSQPLWPQYALLALVFVAIDVLVMGAYALAGASAARRWRARGLRRIHRGAALVLLGLAAALALHRQADG